MVKQFFLFSFCLSILLHGTVARADDAEMEEAIASCEQAVAPAKAWVAGLDQPLVFELNDPDGTFQGHYVGGKLIPNSIARSGQYPKPDQVIADNSFGYSASQQSSQQYLMLAFDDDVDPDASLDELRRRFRSIEFSVREPSPQGLPGCRVELSIDSNTSKDVVKILDYRNRKIRMEIKANLSRLSFTALPPPTRMEIQGDQVFPHEKSVRTIEQSLPVEVKVDLALFSQGEAFRPRLWSPKEEQEYQRRELERQKREIEELRKNSPDVDARSEDDRDPQPSHER